MSEMLYGDHTPEELSVSLPSGVALQTDIWKPSNSLQDGEGNKLAVCLHPWSWLGGRKEDPYVVLYFLSQMLDLRIAYHLAVRVLWSLVEPLLSRNYHVLQYNSRGVGGSSGWASLTGYKEAEDLKALVQWAIDGLSDVRSVVIVVRFVAEYPCCSMARLNSNCLSFLGIFSWLTHSLFISSSSLCQNISYSDIIPSWPQRLAYFVQLFLLR